MQEPTEAPPFRTQLRAMIDSCCPTASDLEEFCSDEFPGVYRRHFTAGMDRVAKITLLLESAGEAAVRDALLRCLPRRQPGRPAPDSLPEPIALTAARYKIPLSLVGFLAGVGAAWLLGAWSSMYELFSPQDLQNPAAWPVGMVCLAGGAITQQTETGEQQAQAKPFCVDRTLVTVAQYRACVSDGACGAADTTNYFERPDVDDQTLYNTLCNARLPQRDDHPINCVSWTDANAYCHFMGKRLLTSAEWEIAAGGQQGQTYPWGWDPPSASLLNACDARCVSWAESHGMKWVLGGNLNVLLANRDGQPSERMFAQDDGFETTSPVASKPPSRPHGLFDLAGNLRQWTTDMPTTCKEANCPVRYILKGGAWSDVHPNHARISWRDRAPPSLRSEMHGFRCGMNWQSSGLRLRKSQTEK